MLPGFLALAGGRIASVLTLIVRMDRQSKQANERIDTVNERTREFADIRERMAKLEGSLDGFLAGRRDRHAA